jgi:hypothetical protein
MSASAAAALISICLRVNWHNGGGDDRAPAACSRAASMFLWRASACYASGGKIARAAAAVGAARRKRKIMKIINIIERNNGEEEEAIIVMKAVSAGNGERNGVKSGGGIRHMCAHAAALAARMAAPALPRIGMARRHGMAHRAKTPRASRHLRVSGRRHQRQQRRKWWRRRRMAASVVSASNEEIGGVASAAGEGGGVKIGEGEMVKMRENIENNQYRRKHRQW